jgi:hypothetical protein
MTRPTHSQTKALLRAAVSLLDAAPVKGGYLTWRRECADFLVDVELALGVRGTEAILEALAPLERGQRGPDKKPRKRRKNAIDLCAAFEVASQPLQSGLTDPLARLNAVVATLNQIAAGLTPSGSHFQPPSP